MRRGKEFSIKLGTNELMNNRLSRLRGRARDACGKQIEAVEKPVVLIGGLGMGFTLRAALTVLGARRGSWSPSSCRRWSPGRGARWPRFWRQPRRSARQHPGDRRRRHHPRAAVGLRRHLLDVDNGPEGLTRKGNNALYNASRVESGQGGAAAGRRARGLVVGTQSGLHKAPAAAPASTSTKSSPRHRKRRRRAPCDLDARRAAAICSPDERSVRQSSRVLITLRSPSYALEHPVVVRRSLRDRLHHVPMLDDLAVLELEDVDDRAAPLPGSRTAWTCRMT